MLNSSGSKKSLLFSASSFGSGFFGSVDAGLAGGEEGVAMDSSG